jgi:hypothetical protein
MQLLALKRRKRSLSSCCLPGSAYAPVFGYMADLWYSLSLLCGFLSLSSASLLASSRFFNMSDPASNWTLAHGNSVQSRLPVYGTKFVEVTTNNHREFPLLTLLCSAFKNATVTPGSRSEHSMIYHAATRSILIFGGLVYAAGNTRALYLLNTYFFHFRLCQKRPLCLFLGYTKLLVDWRQRARPGRRKLYNSWC